MFCYNFFFRQPPLFWIIIRIEVLWRRYPIWFIVWKRGLLFINWVFFSEHLSLVYFNSTSSSESCVILTSIPIKPFYTNVFPWFCSWQFSPAVKSNTTRHFSSILIYFSCISFLNVTSVVLNFCLFSFFALCIFWCFHSYNCLQHFFWSISEAVAHFRSYGSYPFET